MAGMTFRDDRKGQRNSPVTARCIALVLGPDPALKSKKDRDARLSVVVDPLTGEEILAEKTESVPDKRTPQPISNRSLDCFNGKDMFEDFRTRNRTCYWNPALVESVKNLEYLGFVEPCTILVGGEDLHLENVRTAWGRHVLKPPDGFLIEKIGDVGGIQMQVVPQTQFIPLPESLCLIIMDLNNHRVTATLDLIREKLAYCYGPGMQLPDDQLIYDTLGHLIRERKVFHTGSGYFVVTPDTYRLRSDDHSQTYGTTMVPYHPMYIPVPHVAHGNQILHAHHAPMRTISCQTTAAEHRSRSRGKLERSHSMKGYTAKGKEVPQKECLEEPELKRSMSVKYKTERSKTVYKDINLKNSNLNQDKDKGEKVSLLSKLFGKNKKKVPPPPPIKEVEYASFSAQFPPPEWQWYQQQLEKNRRVEDWVKKQIPKSQTWHGLPGPPSYPGDNNNVGTVPVGYMADQDGQGHYVHLPCPAHPQGFQLDPQQHAATLPHDQATKRKQGRSKSLTRPDHSRRHHQQQQQELARSTERLKLSYESYDHGGSSVDVKENADPQLQGNHHINAGPPTASFMSSGDDHTCAVPYHSTPRDPAAPMWLQGHLTYMDDSYQPRKTDMIVENDNAPAPVPDKGDGQDASFMRRAYKAKKKQQRHSSYSHRTSFNEGDISYEYQGKLAKNESSFAVSCESGVNFVGQYSPGFESNQPPHAGHPTILSSPPTGQIPAVHVQSFAQHGQGEVIHNSAHPEGQGRGNRMDHNHARHKTYLMNNSVAKKSHRHRRREQREKCIPEEPAHERIVEQGETTVDSSPEKPVNTEKIDVCVHRNFEDGPLQEAQVKSHAISTTGSSRDGLHSTSEQSCDTIVAANKRNDCQQKLQNKPSDNLTVDGKDLSVGDSGIGSPRNADGSASSDNKFPGQGFASNDCKMEDGQTQVKHGLNILRNTDRSAVRKNFQYRSSSGSAFASHNSLRCSGDFPTPTPLNNQRPLSKESNIDTAHRQRPKSQADLIGHPYGSQNVLDEKLLQVSRKFQMEGDFEVVGVV